MSEPRKTDPGYKVLQDRYIHMGYCYRHFPMDTMKGQQFPNGSGGWEWAPTEPEGQPSAYGGLDICDLTPTYWRQIQVETDELKPQWVWAHEVAE